MLSAAWLQGAALCHQISHSQLQKEGREELREVGKGGHLQRKRDEWKTGRGRNREEGGMNGEELRKEGKERGRKGKRKQQRGKAEQKEMGRGRGRRGRKWERGVLAKIEIFFN